MVNKATLVLVDKAITPHSFLTYIFISKKEYKNNAIPPEIIEHERTHINEKHSLDILFIEVLKIVFWFQPLLYFYKNAIQLNHEFIADSNVVNQNENLTEYQNLLVTSCQQPYSNLASSFNYLATKKRLIMMTKSTSEKVAFLKKIAILPVILSLIFFLCFKIVAQEKVQVKEQENKQTVTIDEQINKKEIEYVTYKTSDSEYYQDVRFLLYEDAIYKKEKVVEGKLIIDKKYEELSSDEKEKFGIFITLRQKPLEKKHPTDKELEEFQNSKKYAIWIDGVNVPNSDLTKYKPQEIVSFSGSVILKNARTKKHPQPFQYWFYTEEYYKEKNMDKYLKRYPGDTIIMTSKRK